MCINRELITLEKAMLAYANWGYIRDRKSAYPYFMKEYNCIHIRENLIKSGYLKLASYLESIPFYPYRELQKLLKEKGHLCGNTKERVIENCKTHLISDDLKKFFGYKCYIPTEYAEGKYNKGIDYHFADLQLEVLQCIDMDSYEYYTKKDKITEIHIDVENSQNSYMLTEEFDFLQFYSFNNLEVRSDVKLFCEDIFLCLVNDVDEVLFFEDEQQIAFVKINSPNRDYLCTIYDIRYQQFQSTYKFTQSPWNYLQKYGLESLRKFDDNSVAKEDIETITNNRIVVDKLLNEQKGIFDVNGSVVYYFSAEDAITELIVENCFNEKVEISCLNAMYDGDFSKKYKMTITNSDKDIEYLILWMFRAHKLTPPKVSGIPVSCFCNGARDVLAQKRYENYSEVKAKLFLTSNNIIENLYELYKIFPAKVLLQSDYYKSYRGKNWFQNRQDYYYVCENADVFETKYKQLYLEAKEKGIIPSRWINEFELYTLIKSYYKDAIYQYRDSWLGLQSLDIFIPSKKVAVEYQGVQHYEAVDRFGDQL